MLPADNHPAIGSPRVTRLAPSPTGALHLGNARTFLLNWALARQAGWRIVMRIEDLDTPRVKVGADTQAIDDLRWLGIDWDGQILYQRANLQPYLDALTHLCQCNRVYRCTCTRKEIEQAQSAPHADDHELRYPGTCRPNVIRCDAAAWRTDEPQATAWRVTAPAKPVSFHDQIHGQMTVDVDRQVGDFVVATKAGLPAYQLAVVVDDARQGVTDIVRGDDLLDSTARQLWLYELLAFSPAPRYWHLPLVLGADGRRLAKRHGDTRLSHYREHGVKSERVIGLVAQWSGVDDRRREMSAGEFLAKFDMAKLPRDPVRFSADDDAWLRNGVIA